MKNAYERIGILEYTKRMKDTTTRIRLHLDRFIGEVESNGNCKAHLISVLGGDSDVGAIWAAVIEQNCFSVEGPGIESLSVSLGEEAQCFRSTISIPARKPVRHIVAVSAELARTRPGVDPEARRTILCDDEPTFMLYRIARRYGLPVMPEWSIWFKDELTRREMIQPIVGFGCSPVLVRGSKKLFLKWIGRALKQRQITFPEANGPVRWTLASSFFPINERDPEDESNREANASGCASTCLTALPAH